MPDRLCGGCSRVFNCAPDTPPSNLCRTYLMPKQMGKFFSLPVCDRVGWTGVTHCIEARSAKNLNGGEHHPGVKIRLRAAITVKLRCLTNSTRPTRNRARAHEARDGEGVLDGGSWFHGVRFESWGQASRCSARCDRIEGISCRLILTPGLNHGALFLRQAELQSKLATGSRLRYPEVEIDNRHRPGQDGENERPTARLRCQALGCAKYFLLRSYSRPSD